MRQMRRGFLLATRLRGGTTTNGSAKAEWRNERAAVQLSLLYGWNGYELLKEMRQPFARRVAGYSRRSR
jgi:hypothetical protein